MAGIGAGAGVAALGAGALLGRMAQTKELKALEEKSLKMKSELFMSRIAKRKETQELQFALYQLKNTVSTLGDHTFSKSFELSNSITSKLGY
jgi:hypothetical protein